jgi:hypothetical protein
MDCATGRIARGRVGVILCAGSAFDGHERKDDVVVTLMHTIGLGLLLMTVLAQERATPQPPALFVDPGACPGECCRYGVWRATREVTLYANPGKSTSVVGRVHAGATVSAVSGEVHTRAGTFVVRIASGSYRPGDVIWVYTRLGEGWYRVWRRGEMVDEEISVAPEHRSPDDWGHYTRPPLSVWWVRLRLQDGPEGWTKTPEHFSGTHSCG